MCLKSEWSYQSWRRSKLSSALCVETTRFFRRGVVRNRSAMVEYSSTITKQLLTTPRRKNLGKFSVICFSRCGVWKGQSVVSVKSYVDVSKLGKEERLPTSSHVSAPSWLPIGTSNVVSTFFYQGCCLCIRIDCFACVTWCFFVVGDVVGWSKVEYSVQEVLANGGI